MGSFAHLFQGRGNVVRVRAWVWIRVTIRIRVRLRLGLEFSIIPFTIMSLF